ncbi:interleukin 17-like protein [Octopus bimaculoides]|uniref:Interleukin 17-like protein n=1 Tax=Octopus bimaculoides TaxID=37653 RepID=A0A0L8GHD3_OCTBM|nr:interleukin 17-like protein [Octopus bimaculoides]|eukprot:XP_014781028.1 PREDICTED: interleukin 17-like protein [Octopus bimaculoides]
MKITSVFIQVIISLFNFTLIVSSAAIPTQCKIPTDLKVHYEKLSSVGIGNNFFLPAEMVPAKSEQSPLTIGDKTCPTSPVSSDIIRERSTCPWYLTFAHDSTVYPPLRQEVVCRCKECLDSDHNHHCVTVYTKTTVLKRTGECVDGLYVYKPSVIDIATACVCARKVDRE